MNRWNLYEKLKNNAEIDIKTVNAIHEMDCEEIKEAVIEYLLARSRQTIKPLEIKRKRLINF